MALHSKKQNQFWVWIAYDQKRRKPIAFHCGCRGSESGKELYKKVKTVGADAFATDCWRAYNEFIPEEKHIRGKRYTQRIEGFNSQVRHFLARFARRTKCYSKSPDAVVDALTLFFFKINPLSIFN